VLATQGLVTISGNGDASDINAIVALTPHGRSQMRAYLSAVRTTEL